jgi:hypothetical protein
VGEALVAVVATLSYIIVDVCVECVRSEVTNRYYVVFDFFVGLVELMA